MADGRRIMDLLWGRGRSSSRGPKPGLDLEQIVRVAIELADAEGLAAVSMRRISERLAVGAMSLYTYVPGKTELLELMADRVLARSVDPVALAAADTWRDALEACARDQWEHHRRHPWTLQLDASRGTLGPNEITAYERTLAAVADLGLPARDAVAMVDAVSMFVRGAAQSAADAAPGVDATGKTELDWWLEREPILGEVLEPARFPVLTRLAADGGFDVPPDTPNYNLRFAIDDFEFGLQRLLDGFEAHVAAAAGGRPSSGRD
jgi:AcrR family transcriptional regulator